MSTLLTVAVLALVTAAIILILVLTARPGKETPGSPPATLPAPAEAPGPPDEVEGGKAGGRRWPCPVCGALLGPGERIRSIVRLSPSHERVMEIHGCPYCIPPGSRQRTCPVCKAELGPRDSLTARVFDRSRESAKPHVQIRGCSRCRP